MFILCSVTVTATVLCTVAMAQRITERKCDEMQQLHSVRTAVIPNFSRKTVHNCLGHRKSWTHVDKREFRHYALLGYFNDDAIGGYEFLCGGSLISEQFVLTAAHCRIPHFVRLGVHDLREEKGFDYLVDEYYPHPEYNASMSYHDIALLELAKKVTINHKVFPACLWTTAILNMSEVMVSGFGPDHYGGPASPVMRKAWLNVLNTSSCDKKFRGQRKFPRGIDSDGQLCLGSDDGADTCQGDSGSAALVHLKSRGCTCFVVGITSIGTPCGFNDTNNVYTKVSEYVQWIEGVVWPETEEFRFRSAGSVIRTAVVLSVVLSIASLLKWHYS